MINREQVKHIAKLARIKLSERELRKFQKELSSILDYFNLLEKADTSKVKPGSHIKEKLRIMRKDIAKSEDPEVVEEMIKGAPDRKERHIKVKAVF